MQDPSESSPLLVKDALDTSMVDARPYAVNGSSKKGFRSEPEEEEEHVGNQLGLVNGVIVPCMLNIVGAILFLRMSWAVGQGEHFPRRFLFL